MRLHEILPIAAQNVGILFQSDIFQLETDTIYDYESFTYYYTETGLILNVIGDFASFNKDEVLSTKWRFLEPIGDIKNVA